MNYQQHAISGFSWQTLQKILILSLGFAKIIILARILSPHDFGLFSLVMIALGTTESLTQTGVNITLVQSKQDIKYFLNSAWVIAIIRGLVIASLMALAANVLVNYYQEPELFGLVLIASLVPLIKGFINPAIAKWQKHFDFRTDSFYQMLRFSVEIAAQITLSFYLRSVWGLVLGVLVSAVFEVALSFLMCRERPVFHYLRSRGEEILKNARWLSISSVLHYLGDNIDDFIIGKLLGTHALGIYHNGYALSHKSNYEFAKSAHHSLMPVFSKIDRRKEKARLRRAFSRSFWSLAGLVTLLSLPLFLFPEPLIRILLGEQWLEAASILPVLVLAGLIHALVNLGYALIVAKKQYFYLNGHLFISLALLIVGIVVGNHYYGLLGAVWGIVISRILSAPIVLWGVRKCLA